MSIIPRKCQTNSVSSSHVSLKSHAHSHLKNVNSQNPSLSNKHFPPCLITIYRLLSEKEKKKILQRTSDSFDSEGRPRTYTFLSFVWTTTTFEKERWRPKNNHPSTSLRYRSMVKGKQRAFHFHLIVDENKLIQYYWWLYYILYAALLWSSNKGHWGDFFPSLFFWFEIYVFFLIWSEMGCWLFFVFFLYLKKVAKIGKSISK